MPIISTMMPTPSIRTLSHALLISLLAASPLAGCASSTPSQPEPDPVRPADAQPPAAFPATRYSGFLGDYARLRQSPRHPGALYEQSARLSSYNAFIVEPITFLPQRTVRGTRITNAESAELAAALHEETISALSLLYPIATEPGPNVAVIRAAITALAGARVDPETGQTQIGGASVEIEILDSTTRERLAAAIESDVVRDATQPIEEDPFSDARLVFRHWAARLNLWLRDADQLATRP